MLRGTSRTTPCSTPAFRPTPPSTSSTTPSGWAPTGPSASSPPSRPWTPAGRSSPPGRRRSEEHTSELQSRQYLVCRLLLEKKKRKKHIIYHSKNDERPHALDVC